MKLNKAEQKVKMMVNIDKILFSKKVSEKEKQLKGLKSQLQRAEGLDL